MTESNGADVHALIGPYVVGALSPAEAAEFEAHLAECSACAAEVTSLREVTVTLADAEATPPPASLRSSVMAAIGTTAQVTPGPVETPEVTPVDEVSERRARKMWPRIAVAAASVLVLAAVGIGVGSAYQQRQQTRALEHDVMMVTTAPDAHAMDLGLGQSHLVMSDSMGAVVAMGDNAPMPASGMEYQLWLMMEDGSSHPGPTFMPHSDGEFMTVMSAPMDGVVGVAVTEEPAGGSPAPTGQTVALVHL